jgi:hypothetical protein
MGPIMRERFLSTAFAVALVIATAGWLWFLWFLALWVFGR